MHQRARTSIYIQKLISSENILLQVPRVSKLLSEFSIYHFFDSPAHHLSCRPQIYPPLSTSVQANSLILASDWSLVITLLGCWPLIGQYLAPPLSQHLVIKLENCCPVFACGDNISWFQTVQNICSGHSILFSIIHLYC